MKKELEKIKQLKKAEHIKKLENIKKKGFISVNKLTPFYKDDSSESN